MTLRSLVVPFLWVAATGCAIAIAGCSASDGGLNGGRINPNGGSNSGTGGSGISLGGNGGATTLDPDAGVVDPNDTRKVPVRQKTCDAAGNCTCLRLALIGTLDSAANNKDTKPFTDWLNGNSGGTATVTMVTTKPTLDDAFLAKYDILLIANVNGWAFSAAEKAAVEKWLRTTGGGIVTLTGFISAGNEPADTSQLISFAGMGYNTTRTAEGGQSVPVYYQGGTTDLKNCLAWTGSSDAIITTPIKFTPQTGQLEKATFDVTYVGAFIGYGVNAPTGSTVLAKDPVSGQNMAVALEVDQTGRIYSWGDEWVIFANQWEPVGDPSNKQQDQYNPCWVPPSSGSDGGAAQAGFFHSVATLYQTKQFWYDVINWVAPPNVCDFTIKDSAVHIY